MEHAGELLGTVQQRVHRVQHVRQQLLLRLRYALEDLEDRPAVVARLLDRARLAPELPTRGGAEAGPLRAPGAAHNGDGRPGVRGAGPHRPARRTREAAAQVTPRRAATRPANTRP